MFQDRRDAGGRLAALLIDEAGGAASPAGAVSPSGAAPPPGIALPPGAAPLPVVVGLARGGVPVAAEIADRLGLPLDVLIARKIGVPWQPELGMGAIAEGGERVLNEELIAEVGVDDGAIDEVTERERHELARRVRHYRGDRPPLPVAGRTAILVDDGLATGYTAWAAIKALRARGARRVVLAVPVAPPDTVATLAKIADRVAVVERPELFMAIGQFYEDFSQISDDEVIAILEAHPAPG